MTLNDTSLPAGDNDGEGQPAHVGFLLIPDFALLDRLTHHCDIVETGNESWRFKNRA